MSGDSKTTDRGWYIAFDLQGKAVPVGRGLALGGWWWCPTATDQRETGWVLGPSFKQLLETHSARPREQLGVMDW